MREINPDSFKGFRSDYVDVPVNLFSCMHQVDVEHNDSDHDAWNEADGNLEIPLDEDDEQETDNGPTAGPLSGPSSGD